MGIPIFNEGMQMREQLKMAASGTYNMQRQIQNILSPTGPTIAEQSLKTDYHMMDKFRPNHKQVYVEPYEPYGKLIPDYPKPILPKSETYSYVMSTVRKTPESMASDFPQILPKSEIDDSIMSLETKIISQPMETEFEREEEGDLKQTELLANFFLGEKMDFDYQPPVIRYEPPEIWETPLPDGTTLIGIVGDGTHTHICPDFIKIKNEETGAFIGWNLTDNQRDFYQLQRISQIIKLIKYSKMKKILKTFYGELKRW